MMEMACVSFNRVRLHYYVSKGLPRAILLNDLLQKPAKLFGTTLIGVNVAMFFGSEFAREFHIAIGLSPDWAPLSQVFLVVILGELAPMFAARSYSEHIAMLGIPLLYASAKVMAPVLWVLNYITNFCIYLINGKSVQTTMYVTQEELKKILEEQEEEQPYTSDKEQFNAITANIFNLRSKHALQIMIPINQIVMLPSNSTVADVQRTLSSSYIPCLPIYHSSRNNIIGIVFPRDLIRAAPDRKVRDFIQTPWFVTQTTKLTRILKQFRHNTKEVVVILNKQGHAIGIIHLNDIVEQIFGKADRHGKKESSTKKMVIIDRTLPGDFTVGEFKKKFNVELDADDALTLEELLTEHLGHHPEIDESIYLEPFEFTVKETSLLAVKKVTVTTKIE